MEESNSNYVSSAAAQEPTSQSTDIRALNEMIQRESAFIDILKMEMDKVIVGQKYMVERLLIGLLADGHILLEGVPGLAKTLAINTLSKCIQADFSRIQFTPDLLPADLLGTMIYNQKKEEFIVRKGPLFSNFILADEINRAPAKVQSALLEAMQERQVTIGDTTFPLPTPFLVLATQNPIEQEGTYPLPEAQVDRFMLKIVIGYPNKEDEKRIIRSNISPTGMLKPNPVIKPEDILRARKVVREVYMDEKIEQYIIDIVFATRFPDQYKLANYKNLITFGASPRASINLALAAKAFAFIKRRGYVIPEDVRAVCHDVLRHRIGLSYEAEAENITSEDIVTGILNAVEVP
ncbi:AAA family ATPase [Mucilaginibacter paludis]|uniref:ATPase associated with various cellular activities AAA_3 n=1 Tax=Mucilaginibacter paludis DSM 18603 TaxID=714943 RepID=H1YDF5_9SPHI|nr:MoxR family ATPase [Mucilaginibacter paludis]EHQ30164.1 ATPase associated with various cellular activities AAA_3 [Mucilaginibacter paludis DSM 18603]